MGGQADRQMHRRVDRETDWQMDGQTDRHTDRRTHTHQNLRQSLPIPTRLINHWPCTALHCSVHTIQKHVHTKQHCLSKQFSRLKITAVPSTRYSRAGILAMINSPPHKTPADNESLEFHWLWIFPALHMVWRRTLPEQLTGLMILVRVGGFVFSFFCPIPYKDSV